MTGLPDDELEAVNGGANDGYRPPHKYEYEYCPYCNGRDRVRDMGHAHRTDGSIPIQFQVADRYYCEKAERYFYARNGDWGKCAYYDDHFQLVKEVRDRILGI